MDRVLLVDGHSVIFAWPALREAQAQAPRYARECLARELASLHDSSDWHVVLVFDGAGAHIGEDHVPRGMQIFYSDARRDADHLIERLALKYASRFQISVASDDQLVQLTISTAGATPISTAGLRALIDNEAKQFRDRQGRHFR